MLLASASPARLSTLRRAGVFPTVRVSGVDEKRAVAEAVDPFGELSPDQEALILARAKAESVAREMHEALENGSTVPSSLPDQPDINPAACAFVIGCDSVLEFEGETLGKPYQPDTAVARWKRVAGHTATLHSGHWLIDMRSPEHGGTGATTGEVASTVVHFGSIDTEEIEAYVATGEPLHAAGGFTIDGIGGPYIDGIEGDHHNVVGISLPLVRRMLENLGVPWRELRR